MSIAFSDNTNQTQLHSILEHLHEIAWSNIDIVQYFVDLRFNYDTCLFCQVPAFVLFSNGLNCMLNFFTRFLCSNSKDDPSES